MKPVLRALIVEDCENDMGLLLRNLKRSDYEIVYRRVDTAEGLTAALDHESWDILFCDFTMPQFSGQTALEIVRKRDLDLPFIFVSGTVGEDVAVQAMKAGAHDYVLKDNLSRLVPAMERELGDAEVRRQRRQAVEDIRRLNADLERRVIERTAQLEAANVELQTEIAERRKVERILHDKNVELQDTAEAKDKFLANMSHELRTPLNGIIGFAEFLLDGKPGMLNPKQKEYLQDILNSGKHLLQLISDLLDLVKIGAGKMEFNPERFSLREVVKEACAVTMSIAQKKGIQIEMNIAPEIGDVTLDQQKFKQILYNLLSNAIKFNDDGGKVEIRAAMLDTNHFKLAVLDNGIGIDSKDLQRLFKEFEQVESGAGRRHEGTGLGLALTRKIVELQGGTISVESKLGKGSSFAIIMPLVMAKMNG